MMGTTPEEAAGDYSYDLAHEAVSGGTPGTAPETNTGPVQVTTDAPSDEGGDYSYDLAHEIPPAGQ